MKKLLLIRGLPGSGKSTMAMQMANYIHFEADMFFMRNGKYCFDASKIQDAHRWCRDKTLQALKAGKNVVVANTFTCKWEMKPYLDMGFDTQIIDANGSWPNIHGVPHEAMVRMKKCWEELPM